MADNATKLSGGDYLANAMCVMAGKKKGGGGGWEVIHIVPVVITVRARLRTLTHPGYAWLRTLGRGSQAHLCTLVIGVCNLSRQ